MSRWMCASLVVLFLSGCGSTGTKKAEGPLTPEWTPPSAPIYCYQTLGAVDCYNTPKPAYRNRLVGYYGPRS